MLQRLDARHQVPLNPPLPTATPNHRHDTLFKLERPGGEMQFLILSLLLHGGGGEGAAGGGGRGAEVPSQK